MNNSKLLSNTLVDSIYPEIEDRERFYREAAQSRFYRSGMSRMLTKEIDALVLKEEGGDDPLPNIAMRKALRHLKRLIELGGLDG